MNKTGVYAMVAVDPPLLKKLQEAEGGSVPTLVVCEEDCEAVASALKSRGVRFQEDAASLEVGSIPAQITLDELEFIASLPGVIAVEYDEEVEALDR